MKKVFALMIAGGFLLGFTACENASQTEGSDDAIETTNEAPAEDVEEPTQMEVDTTEEADTTQVNETEIQN